MYMNCNGIFCPLSVYSINFFSYDDSRNTEEDLDDPQPADEWDIQMECSSDWLYTAQV